MRAVRTAELTGPAGLRIDEVAPPTLGPDEIRVRVRASALNRADLLQSLGLYPAPPGAPADIPGLEYSGEVAEVGARVRRWKPGDAVMGLVSGGAWAEELVTHEREALPVPAGVDLEHAAAIPEAFVTAWDALVLQAGLGVGHHVLIHAVGSGVGTAALQLCFAFGAHPIGTGRTPEKLVRASALGLVDSVIVPKGPPSFASEVRRLAGGRGANVVLDLVGGAWLKETVDALAPGGTLMLVGLVGGAAAEVPLSAVLGKRLRIQGTTLRSRPLEEKIRVARAFEEQVLPLFVSRKLAPVVDDTMPMSDIRAAVDRLSGNSTFGKLVLTW